MASLNKVFLMGNLTRDPDLRTTPSGASVCEFGLAVNRRFTVNGSERDETCFVDITVWSKAAENCKRFLEKGSPVLIEGRLQLDQWDDRDGGGKRSKLRVVAEQVQFLNSRRDGDAAPAPRNEGGYQQQRGNYSRSSYNSGPGGYHGGGNQQPPPMPGSFPPDNGSAEEDIPF